MADKAHILTDKKLEEMERQQNLIGKLGKARFKDIERCPFNSSKQAVLES